MKSSAEIAIIMENNELKNRWPGNYALFQRYADQFNLDHGLLYKRFNSYSEFLKLFDNRKLRSIDKCPSNFILANTSKKIVIIGLHMSSDFMFDTYIVVHTDEFPKLYFPIEFLKQKYRNAKAK